MKEEENLNCGKLYFIEVGINKDNNNFFGPYTEINSYSNYLTKFQLIKGKAIGITSNDELVVWQHEKNKLNSSSSLPSEGGKENNDLKINSNNNYLLKNPIFIFNKIKIKNISINKTMCLSLDINGNVLVWGENKDGLLGLGYDITSVKSPFIIEELKDIVEISLSENHAVVLNSSGVPFSWGLGKFGELGLERTIYNPFPQQMSTDNIYSKVFCGNLITCFIDFEGLFSYFGVIIRSLSGNNATITIKNLLNDELNYDGRTLVFEKIIEELDKEKVINVVIGNGFVGLLSNSGNVYVLEFNDKLTKLYSKYFCYNITVTNNELYGLAKNNNNHTKNISEKVNKENYYIYKWSSKFDSVNSISSDSWTTTIWKINEDFNFNNNYQFLDINNNYKNKMLFILNMNINEKKDNQKNLKNIFQLESEFNDSYNLKYKRVKSRNASALNDISINGVNKSRSLTKYLNKTYNNFFNKGSPNLLGLNYLRNKNNSIYGPRNSHNGYINLRRKNKSNTMKIKESYKEKNLYLEKNNFDKNKFNDYNIYDDTLEFKEKELMKYRNEINNIIKNYKNRNFKSLNFAEIEKDRVNYNKLLKDNSAFNNNQGIFIKNNIPTSGRNQKNLLNSRNFNSKENNNYKRNPINNIDNFNQKEIDSNLEEFFGKESSNIMKNDLYSDINELSNTNLNYLSPNLDVFNKRYNINNSNNLMIYSDRNKNMINNDTLNFSGGNYSNKKIVDDKKIEQHKFFENNEELSPCFSKGHQSINLMNSISSGRITNLDKSINDFFSDDGNKQSKNNVEGNIDKNELYQISDSDKPRNKKKIKNLNIDIQNSNYKSSIENNNSMKNNKLSIGKDGSYEEIDKQLVEKINHKNLKYYKNQFTLKDNKKKEKTVSNFSFTNKRMKIRINGKFKHNSKSNNSSPKNLIKDNDSLNSRENEMTNNENNLISQLEKSNQNTISKSYPNKNISKEIYSNDIYSFPQDSFGNEDYISNEGRRTGKFHKLSEEFDSNNKQFNKSLEQNTSKNYKDAFNNNSKKSNKIPSLYKKINLKDNQINNILNKNFDSFDLPVQLNKEFFSNIKVSNSKITKNSLCYFCFLINYYFKKMAYKMCINEIANYQKYLAKKYAVKIIYRMMKKRILFYEIKFYRRIKKIHRFLVKYEERVNMIKNMKNKKI